MAPTCDIGGRAGQQEGPPFPLLAFLGQLFQVPQLTEGTSPQREDVFVKVVFWAQGLGNKSLSVGERVCVAYPHDSAMLRRQVRLQPYQRNNNRTAWVE